MKQVTMESVKQRIAVLESAGKIVGVLGLGGEFELACLRELVAVTEQRDAVVVEMAALKSNLMFWDAEDPEAPYEHPDEIASECEMAYGTEFTVQVAAKMPNRVYRVVSSSEYSTEVELVEGGEIKTPATDAAIAALRAEGIEQWIASRNGAWNGTTKQAEEFARQLRDSKGANHE
ncbi:MAG: hypothetical protein E6288_03225 [Enterobacteriaceae bacterium]|nr:hypothetical protein [Enterobacteriaceae bacterium]